MLGSSGWIGGFLSPAASEFLSSTFFGLYGCIGVLSTAFLPVAMLLTIAYVGTVNPRLEQAGLLMSRWPHVLWRITLPLIGPAILFAAVLVFLLTLGEVGRGPGNCRQRTAATCCDCADPRGVAFHRALGRAAVRISTMR